MNEQTRNKNISFGIIAGISATVVIASGTLAWFMTQTPNTSTTNTTSSQTIKNPTQQLNSQAKQEQTANIYWLRTKDQGLDLVSQPLKIAATQPDKVLEKAFTTLFAGPTQGTDSTTIPPGTKLLGIIVKNNNIEVNLSEQFTSGGGSTSMIGRLGQIVYTATTLNPQGEVYIQVNGKPLEVLGGEGVEIEQPLTREKFNKNYPL